MEGTKDEVRWLLSDCGQGGVVSKPLLKHGCKKSWRSTTKHRRKTQNNLQTNRCSLIIKHPLVIFHDSAIRELVLPYCTAFGGSYGQSKNALTDKGFNRIEELPATDHQLNSMPLRRSRRCRWTRKAWLLRSDGSAQVVLRKLLAVLGIDRCSKLMLETIQPSLMAHGPDGFSAESANDQSCQQGDAYPQCGVRRDQS